MNENLLPSGRSRWWICFLLGRMVAYGLLGGLACAMVGAFLVAGAGALTGVALTYPRVDDTVGIGAYIGVILGSGGGSLMGVVMLGIASFFEPPQSGPTPPRRILGPTLLGMALATLGIMGSFAVLIGASALAEGNLSWQSFSNTAEGFLLFILFGVPAAMMCGGVVGAICGMRRKPM